MKDEALRMVQRNHSVPTIIPQAVCRLILEGKDYLRYKMSRKGIKTADEMTLLTQCGRRCCLCYGLNGDKETKRGQIAHIDQDHSNSELENLVWLCFNHHDEYDSTSRQSKGITKRELIYYKQKLELSYPSWFSNIHHTPLMLLDSFPKSGQTIKFTELSERGKVFLKFNKPLDRESASVIRNYYMRCNLEVQWSIGGWIQYKEDDSKLVWHPNPQEIERIKNEAQKAHKDEHILEILIGTNQGNRVKGKDGSLIEPTALEVFIDMSTDTISRAEVVRNAIIEIDGLVGYQSPNSPTFDDVPATHWDYDFIESAVQLGIVSGYVDEYGNLTGLFGPDDIADRAWTAKVLVNSFSIPSALTPPSPFTDIQPGHAYYNYVITAYNQSVINELTGTMFHPNESITRATAEEWLTKAKNPILRTLIS